MTKGFFGDELVSILDGYYYGKKRLEEKIIDFEYTPRQLENNEVGEGMCFISISNQRWNKEHNKRTNWKDGNVEILPFSSQISLIITEEPIKELKDKVTQIIVDNSYRSIQLIAHAARGKMTNKVIGITGSVGKSSTRIMLEHLLAGEKSYVSTRGNHNTQAGVPLYGAKLCCNPGIGILEVSLNALNNRGNQSLVIRPDICLITSIGEAHLSTLHSTENVAKFKSRIFEGLTSDGLVIINNDIEEAELSILLNNAKKRTANIKLYSLKNKNADMYLKRIIHKKYESIITIHYKSEDYQFKMKMPSLGIIMNTLAALLCLAELGFELENLLPKIHKYHSLDRVMQLKQIKTSDSRKVDIIDDSHNAAIPSMINAIETFKEKGAFYKGNKILVLGQVADLGDQSQKLHSKFIPLIKSSDADYVFGHGHYMREVIKELPNKMIGGWFNNAKDMSRHIPFYCTEDSLVLMKGSVSGSDFRTISYLLPAQLKRSNQILANYSPINLVGVLQPVFGASVFDLNKNKEIYTLGYSSTQTLEGLSPLILLYLLYEKEIKLTKITELKGWATNQGRTLKGRLFSEGEYFTHEELLDELIYTQHPSAIFQLANIYFGKRNNSMKAIIDIANRIEINPSATLNLSGRYRVKEQQTYKLEDLRLIGRLLKKQKDNLPILLTKGEIEVRGIIFGKLRYSTLSFYQDKLITASGLKTEEEVYHLLNLIIDKEVKRKK